MPTTSKDTVIATVVIMSADVCWSLGVCGRGMELFKTPFFRRLQIQSQETPTPEFEGAARGER